MSRATSRLVASAALAVGLGALSMGTAAPARAQAFRLDQYRPAPTVEDGFTVARPTRPGHLRVAFDAHLAYALSPLVLESFETGETTPLVEHAVGLHVGAALGLFDRLLVFARMPVMLAMEGESVPGYPDVSGAALSDLVLGARWRLHAEPDERFALALSLTATAPTASLAEPSQQLVGENGVTFTPSVVAEVRPVDRVNISANVGARFRDDASLPNLAIGHELTFGLALGVWVVDDLLEARLETWGASSLERFGDEQTTPWEALLGARIQPLPGLVIGLAGGLGLGRGVGTPAFRGVLSVGYITPGESAPTRAVTAEVEEPSAVTPAPLARRARADDSTGLPTWPSPPGHEHVAGPNPEYEVVPRRHPEGVDPPPPPPHSTNVMPTEGPTRRAYAELDRDNDGIPDAIDRCPLDPEDYDEIEDDDGCPEVDADGDGIPDVDDHCPTTAGSQTTGPCAGCPERACMVQGGSIVISDRVEFAVGTADIEDRSLDVLRDVLSILRTNPQIERVRIEGHTDSVGNDASNLELSARRAREIVRWLEGQHIGAERLEAWGCGEVHPIASNESEAGRQRNRRVEFLITVPSSGQVLREGCVRAP